MAALAPTAKVKLELATGDDLERKFIAALCSVYPSGMRAYELMRAIGMAVPLIRRSDGAVIACKHVNDFISFCNLRIRSNHALAPHGWQAVRDGGTVLDKYRLVPVA